MAPFSMFSGLVLCICQLTYRETMLGYVSCLLVCEMNMQVFSSVYQYHIYVHWVSISSAKYSISKVGWGQDAMTNRSH